MTMDTHLGGCPRPSGWEADIGRTCPLGGERVRLIGTLGIEGASRCRRAGKTVGTVQICILPISHRHDVEDLYFYLSSGF